MWLITTIGFFSAVQKHGTTRMTARACVASDLDNLRNEFMLQLSPTIEGGRTDYPFRATISRKDFGTGLAKVGESMNYPDFKNAVGDQMRWHRKHPYHKVWQISPWLGGALADGGAKGAGQGMSREGQTPGADTALPRYC